MKAEIKAGVSSGLHGDDLQGFDVYQQQKEEIWFQNDSSTHQNDTSNHHQNDDVVVGGGILLDDVDMDVSDPSSLFYAGDDFPSLPDFPCMSSSSSSSSAPQKSKPFASSSASSSASSGAASWSADHEPSTSTAAPPSDSGGGEMGSMSVEDVDQCMDMMENFGCIDLLESGDICWDPSPLFDNGGDRDGDGSQQLLQQQQLERAREREEEEERAIEEFMLQGEGESGSGSFVVNVDDVIGGNKLDNNSNGTQQPGDDSQHREEEEEEEEGMPSSDELAMVFFEWLKTNKEAISAEDLRNIKIKKSTIEAAAKRLGGGKEGMKQLLKLILQWVQNHHLTSKKECSSTITPLVEDHTITTSNNNNNNNSSIADLNPSPNPNPNLNPNLTPPPLEQQASTAASSCLWVSTPPPQPFVPDPAAIVAPPPPPPPMVGYMGSDPYSTGMAAYPPPDYHQMMDTAPHSWAPPMQFGMGPPQYGSFLDTAHAAQFGGYPVPPYPGFYYHPGPGEGLVRLGSSATKEARKKRMARQRRIFTHHHRSHHHNQNQNQNNNQMMNSNNNLMVEQHGGVGNGNCGGVAPHLSPSGNWVYWSHPPPLPPQVGHSVGGPPSMMGQMHAVERPAPSGNGFQRQVGVEKKQGWKSEKNLRFLLQKVLKQSDVGNLGRIVLPKKEAETHLPELEARDGIPIAMEDIGTSRVWNMRYRFWPNNKSRMYLLENTGDFVRSNGLQEGDFIVIYSDVKCGKYMIRGVKVRPQQQGAKPETTNKKSCKTQKTHGCSSPAGNGLSSSPSIMQNKLI